MLQFLQDFGLEAGLHAFTRVGEPRAASGSMSTTSTPLAHAWSLLRPGISLDTSLPAASVKVSQYIGGVVVRAACICRHCSNSSVLPVAFVHGGAVVVRFHEIDNFIAHDVSIHGKRVGIVHTDIVVSERVGVSWG